MNEYKITYSNAEGNGTTHVIEVSEIAALKVFKADHKGWEITDTELVAVDVTATKQQEREALEKIKAMVAELGPQSYLATAFEGVFEDAETNIENDFAFSMKARVESAEEKLERMGSDYNALKRDAALLQERLTAAQEQIKAAQEQTAALKRRQLTEELRRDLWTMATSEAEASRARMAKAAHMMAVCADNPACVGFKESVADYRKEEKRAEAMEQRAAQLDAMEPKNN